MSKNQKVNAIHFKLGCFLSSQITISTDNADVSAKLRKLLVLVNLKQRVVVS